MYGLFIGTIINTQREYGNQLSVKYWWTSSELKYFSTVLHEVGDRKFISIDNLSKDAYSVDRLLFEIDSMRASCELIRM